MILTGVPMATAAGSGFVSPDAEAPSYEGGPLSCLWTPGLRRSPACWTPPPWKPAASLENEPKIVHDASGRFSLTEAGQTKTPEDTDVVNFIVVMKEQSLLAAGFSTDAPRGRLA